MSDLLSRRLELLAQAPHIALLSQCLHGIERETLRVTEQGTLATTEHPKALGSALTHAQITTDYSESLLEFITGVHTNVENTLEELEHIHQFAAQKLNHELLWSASMPCILPQEDEIPIAQYGSSHIGQLKYVYRKGLALRYGRTMQCIAGIHYNFSVPERLWELLNTDNKASVEAQSEGYIALIRNFRRYSWLLMYLFGASPALDKGFMRGRPHQLESFDADTLYLPWATSLRMSDLGYQSNAQAGLTPCYNDLESYTSSLRQAVATPYAPYEAMGTHKDGEWQQLNTHILQIENEYYSSIRPKRVTKTGERPIQALIARGVQYVEMRCLDINPFLPLGIDAAEARFLDTFLLCCALSESPLIKAEECASCTDNFKETVLRGRQPGLELKRGGQPILLKTWACELIEAMRPIATLIDQSVGGKEYQNALVDALNKVNDVSLTPSAKVLAALREAGSFATLALKLSTEHTLALNAKPLSTALNEQFAEAAKASLEAQQTLEATQEEGDFASFVAAYQASILGVAV